MIKSYGAKWQSMSTEPNILSSLVRNEAFKNLYLYIFTNLCKNNRQSLNTLRVTLRIEYALLKKKKKNPFIQRFRETIARDEFATLIYSEKLNWWELLIITWIISQEICQGVFNAIILTINSSFENSKQAIENSLCPMTSVSSSQTGLYDAIKFEILNYAVCIHYVQNILERLLIQLCVQYDFLDQTDSMFAIIAFASHLLCRMWHHYGRFIELMIWSPDRSSVIYSWGYSSVVEHSTADRRVPSSNLGAPCVLSLFFWLFNWSIHFYNKKILQPFIDPSTKIYSRPCRVE
jgi:hypothetical protein